MNAAVRVGVVALASTLACTESKPRAERPQPTVSATVAAPAATACELAVAGAPEVLVPESANPFNVDVAATEAQFLVAYQAQLIAIGPPTPVVVRARIFDRAGQPLTEELTLSGTNGTFIAPTVTAVGGRYLVTWQHPRDGGLETGDDTPVEARWVEPDGRLSAQVRLPSNTFQTVTTPVPTGFSLLYPTPRLRGEAPAQFADGETVMRQLLDRNLAPIGGPTALLDTDPLGNDNLAELPLPDGGSLVAIASAQFRSPGPRGRSIDQIHLLRLDASGRVVSVVVEIPTELTAVQPRMLATGGDILLAWLEEEEYGASPVRMMVATIDASGKVLREPHEVGEGGRRFGGPELSRVRGVPAVVFDAGRIQQLSESGDPAAAALKVAPETADYGWWIDLGRSTGVVWTEPRERFLSVHFAPLACK